MTEVSTAQLGQMLIDKCREANTMRKFAGQTVTRVEIEIDGRMYHVNIYPKEQV